MMATITFDPRKLAAAIGLLLAASNGATCAVQDGNQRQLEMRCAAGMTSLAERLRDTLLEQGER